MAPQASRALPLAVIALLSSPLAVIAQTSGPPPGDNPGRSERPNPPQGPSKEAREAHLKREAEAMAKLSVAQRKAYFQARQDIQRQLFDKRVGDLKRFGQCYELATSLPAMRICCAKVMELPPRRVIAVVISAVPG